MKNFVFTNILKCAAIIISTFLAVNAYGQSKAISDSIFEEDFENGLDKWTQVHASNPTRDWSTKMGGATPLNGSGTKPESAQSGDFNAYFYISSVQYTYSTYLISPTIDFTDAHKPLLKFWYSLYESQMGEVDNPEELITDNFEFTLCYRLSPTSNWVEYRNYKDATNDVTPWRCDSIYLPEVLCGNAQVQIAFLGKTKSIGLGICIDNIKIRETLVINKYVTSIYASQPNTNMVPTSSTDNPVMMLRIPVLGNNGTLLLKSLTATAMQQASLSIKENGMKLFYTQNEEFRTNRLLATTSIDNNGKATFSNINFDLPLGNAYLWITCNIKDEDGEHRLKNNKIEFKIEPNAINIGNSTYPINELPEKEKQGQGRLVNESIFFDNFELASFSNENWTFEGEFERAEALGKGGDNGGNSDPDYARSGNFIIGTDVTGIGSDDHSQGNYEKDIDNRAYTATTKNFTTSAYSDLAWFKYYKDINILYYRWLNCNTGDSAFVSYSLNGGTTWSDAWRTTAIMQESNWNFQKLNISKYADKKESIKLQVSLGPTPSQLQYSGWNIDDFALVGTFVYADAAITEITAPNNGCGFSTKESVSIKIKNAGFNDITIPFTVSYSIDGGRTWTDNETITRGLVRDEVYEYTFNAKADLSNYGWYDIRAKVTLDEDEYPQNNSMRKKVLSLPYHNLPYAQDFNTSHGHWYSFGDNSTWEYGTLSGARCWATKLTENYPACDSAWLESPCFDFSNIQKPMLSFNLKADAANTDGLAVYFSTDNGATWTLIPYGTSYPRLSWYNTNSNIAALGTKGWTGNFDWTFIQQLLPSELAGESSVKLKFLFQSAASDEPTGHNGFAIDDIRLYEAPADAGVAEIVTPVSACYLDSTQQITVRIQNYGIRGITRADSLFTTVTVNDRLTITDTFLLAINDTIKVNESKNFIFRQKVNMWNKNDYVMTAYTDVTGDTLLFSATNNDTIPTKSITATVWGEPAYTLGPDIGTLNPTAINIFGGKQSDDNWFKSYLWEPLKDSENNDVTGGHNSTQRWIGILDSDKLPGFPDGKEKGYYYEYQITVTTQEHNCVAKDTIRIIKSETDISIDNIAFNFDYPEEGSANPQEFTRITPNKPEFGNTQYCISKQPEKVTVTVKNNAEVKVDQGEKISLCYTYLDADNNICTYAEDTIMQNDMLPDASFEYTFKQAPELTLGIMQELHFFVRINADMKHNNDSATININAWPLPTADLGNDSLLIQDPSNRLLTTPNISNASYLWQDGLTTSRSFVITETNTSYYWVSVTDEHNCGIATDSILIVSDNWKIDEIVSPNDQCEPIDAAELSVSITNLSVNDYSNTIIPVAITINGEVTNSVIEIEDLAAGESLTYTFNDMPIDMSEPGTYSISVRILPTHDINRNDNITYKDVNIWGVRQVDLGDDLIFTLEADTITLDAGEGFKSYYWVVYNDDKNDTLSTEQTFTIPSINSKTYAIQVEDFHDCPESEFEVTIMPFDLSITEISSPKTSCDLNSATTAELKIYNNSNEKIDDGTPIYVYVQTDNGDVFEHEQDLPEIEIGQSQQISFNYTPTFTGNTSDHTVKMWLSWDNDVFYDNDTLSQTIHQYAKPEPFDLGSDIYTTRPDTVQLVAPSGYSNYIWSNDSTGSNTLNVNYSGSEKYWVRVVNGYGCATTDSISIFTTDVTLSIVEGAANSCLPVNNDSVKAQIKVNRNNTVPAGAQFTATFECNGYTDTKEIVTTKDITFDEPYTFSFDKLVTLPDTGNYALTTNLTVHNTIDVNSDNNAATPTVRIGALQLPFKDTVRTYDDIYIIDAGTQFSTFSWVDNPLADQRLAVVTSGKYTVNVVDTNGCANTDSTYIYFVVPSYEISGLGFASTMCAPSDSTEISFYVKNTGNDLVTAGTVIPASYKIDNNATVSENFTLTKNLREKDSLLIQFNTKADVRETGSYTMMLNADVNGYETSSLKTITVMENPSPDLGEDINTDKDSWQLTPGINFGQFLWSTGETNYYIDVTTSGDYWVTVTNNYGCSANDTVSVHFTEPEVSVAAFNSAAAYCGDVVDQNFEINLSNSGVKNVAAGHTIGITCAVGDTTVTDSITLPNDFFAGASFNHKLAAPVSIKGVGAHTLAFTVSIDGKQTDISAFTVNIYDFPTFKFASDELVVDEYPYTLTAPVANAGYLWSDGSTESSISVSEDGTYSLTVTDENNCSASSSISIKLKIIDNPGGGGGQGGGSQGGGGTTPPEDTTAINSLAEGEIGIYPNPADNAINIDFSQSQLTGSRIWISSVTGKVLMTDIQTSDIMQIDISNWPQGIYIIKIVNGGSSGFIKFVKR
ncbi:MAG: T9SS type A sorting domain-containing protein [Salinivirgaceae bacterium]|nr:T9SS type A sorting domain-containing protein [Salinivirgaceae bacterium]